MALLRRLFYTRPMHAFACAAQRRWALVAAVGILAATAATPVSHGRATAATKRPASVFVAPNGSDARSCKSRKVACATFNRAYRVARPGQVVEVAGGRYRSQRIVAASGKRAPNIVFRPARGARVVLQGLSFGSGGDAAFGPRNITMRGMSTARKGSAPGARNRHGIFVGPGSRAIRLVRMRAGSVDTWLADRVTVLGGSYGPCDAVWGASNVCGNNKIDVSTNVLVQGATFHDLRFDATCFPSGADCHWECMYVNGGKNVTIRSSKFRDCALFDIFATISGPDAGRIGHRNLTIENNWFDTPWDENRSGPPRRARPSAVSLAWCQNSPNGYRGVRIRFNSFHRNTGIALDGNTSCTFENVRVTGNLLMYPGSCARNVSYGYNLWGTAWRRGRCAGTDRIGGQTFAYKNPSSGREFDFHLVKGRKTKADNAVPRTVAGGCPRRDVDGQRRPLQPRCDAGSDERRTRY